MREFDDATHAALAAIRAAERLDWFPGVPMPPGAFDPRAVLRAAPRAATVAALAALSREAAPAGHVWATQLLLELDPKEGWVQLEALATDPSPVEVNTCLRGYRTVAEWALDARLRAQPAPRRPPRRWWWPW